MDTTQALGLLVEIVPADIVTSVVRLTVHCSLYLQIKSDHKRNKLINVKFMHNYKKYFNKSG